MISARCLHVRSSLPAFPDEQIRARMGGGWRDLTMVSFVSSRSFHHGISAMTASSTYCPDRKPPIWAVKRPERPHKSAIQNRFTIENVKRPLKKGA